MDKGERMAETTHRLHTATEITVLGEEEIGQVAKGACFLASGGGGSLQLALQKIIPHFFNGDTQIPVASPDLLGFEGDWGAVVAGMGSPLKMFENPGLVQSAVPTFEKLRGLVRAFQAAGQKRFESVELVDFCLPVETGAVNSLVPMIVASQVTVPRPVPFELFVIDADGAGRAVPTLPLTTYARQLELYPNVLGGNNNTKKGSTHFDYASLNVEDETTLETACLGLIDSEAFGAVSGLAIYAASGPSFQKCRPVAGGISDALALGKILDVTSGAARVQEVVAYVNKKMGRRAKEIFSGKVTKMKEATSSLDNGYVLMEGDGSFTGLQLRLLIENENIWGELIQEGKSTPYIMGPDSMNYLTDSGDVVDNSDLWKLYDNGQHHPHLSIVGIEAAKEVRENAGLMQAWVREVSAKKGPTTYTTPWLEG